MALKDEIQSDNQRATEWLLLYPGRKKQYLQDRQSILHGSPAAGKTGGSRSSMPGNPTLRKAVGLGDLIETEKWLQTVDDVLSVVGVKKQVLVAVRREAIYTLQRGRKDRGRPAWMAYVQRRYVEELAKMYGGAEEKYWANERNLQKMWSEIVNLVVRVALKRRLL